MIPRILEPEVMESADEAREYDAMDHAAVNKAFVDDFEAALTENGLNQSRSLQILDCGTGTALIPILLAARFYDAQITATDLSEEMLKFARGNVEQVNLSSRITLRREDGKGMTFANNSFDAVISNSLIHHVPDPRPTFVEMVRILRPGGLLFVRDLLRPDSLAQLDELVERRTIGATDHQRTLFQDSLHAALTVDEVEQMLGGLSLENVSVEQTSDRHWTVTAVKE